MLTCAQQAYKHARGIKIPLRNNLSRLLTWAIGLTNSVKGRCGDNSVSGSKGEYDKEKHDEWVERD